MKITAIEPVRHQNRVDIEVTLDDGTKCTYIPNTPPSAITGVVVTDGVLTNEMRQLAANAAEKWIGENPAVIDELLAR